jgi:hypothetical protein
MSSVEVEDELRKNFNLLAAIVRAQWYEWREAALHYARPDVRPLDLVLKAWEIVGHDTAKSYLKRLRNSPTLLKDLAGCIVFSSTLMGEDAKVIGGEKPNEVFVRWDRCPWPEFAKRYNAPLEEDLLGCDKWLQTVVEDINKFFNVKIKIETLKAIPLGDGICLRRLFLEER